MQMNNEQREAFLFPRHKLAIEDSLRGFRVDQLLREASETGSVSIANRRDLPAIIGTRTFATERYLGLNVEDE